MLGRTKISKFKKMTEKNGGRKYRTSDPVCYLKAGKHSTVKTMILFWIFWRGGQSES